MNTEKIKRKRCLLYYACGQKICRGCGKYMPFEKMTLDHKVPKSKGGTLANTNIQLMCQPCNVAKGNRMPEEVCA